MLQKKEIEAEKEKFFQYLGHSYIKVFNEKVPNVTFDGKNIIAKNEKMLEKFYKKECERIFQSEVERITPFFQSIPSFTLKIRTMKTRWGVNNITNKSITLNSELLKPMREQFEIILNRLVGIVATQNKEAEITLKLNLDSTKQYEEVDEKTVKEWVEPRIDYSISEKIKETKNTNKGLVGFDYQVKVDEENNITYVEKINEQTTLFGEDE